ncbi:hypothetical protein Tco_1482795 [Tanacetum coccineum]
MLSNSNSNLSSSYFKKSFNPNIQQHQGESLFEAWTRFKDLLQKVSHHGIDLWLQVQIFYDHVNPATRRTVDQSASGKLRDRNAKESWALLKDLALCDNESLNDQRDFANGPHDTQYYMENLEQDFVDYASSCTDEAGGLVSNFMASQDAKLSKFEADFKQQQSKMTNKIDTVLEAITDQITGALPSDTVRNPKLNVNSTSPVLSTRSYSKVDPNAQPKSTVRSILSRYVPNGDDGDMMFIEIIEKNDDSHKEEPEVGENARVGELEVEYFDVFLTKSELAYHKYLMYGPIPIIIEGCPSNLKIPCNIRHVHIEKAYIDLNSTLNIMTRMLYNWIMKRKLDPRENTNGGLNNFIGMIKGMHVFVENFTYVIDFMIVDDNSSIIDPRLSQVVLGKPFFEISNMTHDPPEGVVRNEEDKRRGVEYMMSKILGFYNECLELGPEYATGIADEGEVTKFFKENEKKIFTVAGDGVRIYPDGVVIFDEKKLGSS